MEMASLVTKLLGPPEEIDPCARSRHHAHRWMICGNQHFKVYLHHTSNEDLAADLLPYPQQLLSMGFGNYTNNFDGAPSACADRSTWMLLIAKPPHSQQELPELECPSLALPSTFGQH